MKRSGVDHRPILWIWFPLLAVLLSAGAPPGVGAQQSGPAATYLPLMGKMFYAGTPPLLISAVHYDSYLTGEPDEAFQLYNPLDNPVPLEGWQVDDGRHRVAFGPGASLPAQETIWCARSAISFTLTFGVPPGCEYGAGSSPGVLRLYGSPLQFVNTGGSVRLLTSDGAVQDLLVYGTGDTSVAGWRGPAVNPYLPSTSFGREGQILYRKLDQLTGRPGPDTGTRADWASDPNDVINGRKARYPGGDLEQFFRPQTSAERGSLQIIVSPDNAYPALSSLLAGARRRIRFEGFTFDSARLGALLAGQARMGVAVEILLEGDPPGGVTDQQRWIIQQIAVAGGQVYYMRRDPASGVRTRYTYQHGKFWLLDDRLALIGTENPSDDSFPDDDKSDGTLGQRGLYLVTDAPAVVANLAAVMDADLAPGVHHDIFPWEAASLTLGAPPPGFSPSYAAGGSYYPVQKPQPLDVEGTFTSQVILAPEQALRDQDSLLGLIARAGKGDTVLVEQLYEQTYWGAETSNVSDNPNPRLLAYAAAARRGARVRVLLDAFFDDQDLRSPRSNLRTVEYLTAVARAEGLDLEARRGNPTGQGIHNKMVLVQIAGRGWVVAGSLNGGEVSAKLNREVALEVASDAAYDYLSQLFWYDWNAP